MPTVLAEVTRGDVIESVHWGHVAVVNAEGALVASGGNLGARTFLRAAAMPFGAVPLVATGAVDAFALSIEELAIACASHTGTERHQAIVLSLLGKAGCAEGDLRCGFSPPLDAHEVARIALGFQQPATVQCECSGEHAGMLAACRHAGWSIDGYLAPCHPLQHEVLSIVAAACGLPLMALTRATDGCGLPTWAVPMEAMARAYAVLADPNRASWHGPTVQRMALLRIRQAMADHPDLISGDGKTDTEITRVTEGRVIAKFGGEGLLCLAVPDYQLGIAIRDISGSSRALGPAAVAALTDLKVEGPAVLEELRNALCQPVTSFSGQVVGSVRPALQLRHAELV